MSDIPSNPNNPRAELAAVMERTQDLLAELANLQARMQSLMVIIAQRPSSIRARAREDAKGDGAVAGAADPGL